MNYSQSDLSEITHPSIRTESLVYLTYNSYIKFMPNSKCITLSKPICSRMDVVLVILISTSIKKIFFCNIRRVQLL